MSRWLNMFQVGKWFLLHEFADPTTDEVKIDARLITRLDSARELFGRPIKVTSGYRTREHNAQVGGKPNSKHLLGCAADLVPLEGTMEELTAVLATVPDLFVLNEGDHVHVHLDFA